MIVDFGMAPDTDLAGYYAGENQFLCVAIYALIPYADYLGWITGMFMIGRTIASIPWGIVADRWGRVPCLVLSMVNVAIFGVLFVSVHPSWDSLICY